MAFMAELFTGGGGMFGGGMGGGMMGGGMRGRHVRWRNGGACRAAEWGACTRAAAWADPTARACVGASIPSSPATAMRPRGHSEPDGPVSGSGGCRRSGNRFSHTANYSQSVRQHAADSGDAERIRRDPQAAAGYRCAPRQVLIEAKIYEVTLTGVLKSGVRLT